VIIVILSAPPLHDKLIRIPMSYTVVKDSLAALKSYRAEAKQKLNWSSVFILPEWLQVWWTVFGGGGGEMRICTVRDGEKIAGIAPLIVKDSTARLIGDIDVCDYLDFIVTPGMEKDVFTVILDDLKENGIRQLDLAHVRPDSTVMSDLAPLAEGRGCEVDSVRESVSLEMDLPSTWDEYLSALTAKQRHEVRRKLRRLNEEGRVAYRSVSEGAAVPGVMETFFRMFVESRQDKADFLTDKMRSFFISLAETMSGAGLLRLGVLELDGQPLAEIMCFDYNGCIYLYNSGYDPKYIALSAGLLSKALAVKDSIERGKRRFDFLKGDEVYKRHLGGREVPLFRCRITIR
jgi:CelD/BcsL family acetyltransferase involved in cellulose biosynthesis